MKNIYLLIGLILPTSLLAQSIPPKANTILVHGVTFAGVCNALLDSGYKISKKDNDLQTVETEERHYPNKWNATYRIEIRIKDSVAIITALFTAPPGGGLFLNEPAFYRTKKNGEPQLESLQTVAFLSVNRFATSLSRDVSYDIRQQ